MLVPERICQALVFAAGYGQRMGELTKNTPKPLLPLTSIDDCVLGRILAVLERHDLARVVVNAHYHSEQIKDFVCSHFRNVGISEEKESIETGGGLLKALKYFDHQKPLLILNGDTHIETLEKQIQDLSQSYYLTSIKYKNIILLSLGLQQSGILYNGRGDYIYADHSNTNHLNSPEPKRIVSHTSGDKEAFVFIGPRILSPFYLNEKFISEYISCEKKFSIKKLFDDAEKNNRLHGLVFYDQWCAVDTPEIYHALKKNLLMSSGLDISKSE